MDGVDIALCRFRQAHPSAPLHLKLEKYDEVPIPSDIKERLLGLIKSNTTAVAEISQVNVILGHLFADSALAFCKKHGISLDDIDIVGSHGQTIWYIPVTRNGEVKSTLTMAEGTVIANKLGKTAVNDFRISEQSVGRQGAPLIAFFDGLLLVHPTKYRACQNIGGISNVSYIPPESDGGLDKIFDFDCGPGNIFIDAAMRYFTNNELEYDKDGKWGLKGKVDQEFVDEFLKQPYFNAPLPKTTGRETFGDNKAYELVERATARGLNKYDTIASITRITSQAIVNDYKRYLPRIDELYLCGGGAKNINIVSYIQENFPNTKILMLDDAGMDGAAKEAVTFAFQGLEAILGRPLIVPDRVESSTPVVVGKVSPGLNYRELQRNAVKFGVDYECENYLPSVRKLIID